MCTVWDNDFHRLLADLAGKAGIILIYAGLLQYAFPKFAMYVYEVNAMELLAQFSNTIHKKTESH